MSKERQSWDDYFLNIVNIVSNRATCNRGRAGCVIVRDNHILSTGYVGSPPKIAHCDDIGHLMIKYINHGGVESNYCARTIHCEMNAIAYAAKMGIKIDGATLYCKNEPCYMCAKLIVAVGIKKVVVEFQCHTADSLLTRKLFKEIDVELVVLNNVNIKYEEEDKNIMNKDKKTDIQKDFIAYVE